MQLQFEVADVKDAITLLEALSLMVNNALNCAEFEFQGSVNLSRVGWIQEVQGEEETLKDVVLVIWAPKPITERFFESLVRLGRPYSMEMVAEKLLFRCRLIPPPPQE
ncbi:MAG: hypothetical protein JRI66_11390 [Deltaproteobacteria bacterium]|nr:hypothetical protein [Deltaproteobacteria bacterium]